MLFAYGIASALFDLVSPVIFLFITTAALAIPIYASACTSRFIARRYGAPFIFGLLIGLAAALAVLFMNNYYFNLFDWMLNSTLHTNQTPGNDISGGDLITLLIIIIDVVGYILALVIQSFILVILRELTRIYVTTSILASCCIIISIRSAKGALDNISHMRPYTQMHRRSKRYIAHTIMICTLLLSPIIIYAAYHMHKHKYNSNSRMQYILTHDAPIGEALFVDEFNNNANHWSLAPSFNIQIMSGHFAVPISNWPMFAGKAREELFSIAPSVELSKYQIIKKSNMFYGFCASPRTNYSMKTNHNIELTIDSIKGLKDRYIGLSYGGPIGREQICPRKRTYAFMANSDGAYKWVEISDKGKKAYLSAGDKVLRVDYGIKTILSGVDEKVARGKELKKINIVHINKAIKLYINDIQCACIICNQYPIMGGIGIVVEEGIDAYIDRVAVHSIIE